MQAALTGERIAAVLSEASASDGSGGRPVVRLHVSGMARAQETAGIIHRCLPSSLGVEALPPNPNLNEGRPAHSVPEGSVMNPKSVHRDGPRIETAFRQIFHRSDPPRDRAVEQAFKGYKDPADPRRREGKGKDKPGHEYDIVVCHGNVIRCEHRLLCLGRLIEGICFCARGCFVPRCCVLLLAFLQHGVLLPTRQHSHTLPPTRRSCPNP